MTRLPARLPGSALRRTESKGQERPAMKGENTMNNLQTSYAIAKATVDAIHASIEQAESEYCAANNCTDEGGNPATRIYHIDDEIAFAAANSEFCALHAQEYEDSRKAETTLRSAEDALIAWGISIMPASMTAQAETLERGAKSMYWVREKLINLAFRLDHRTIRSA